MKKTYQELEISVVKFDNEDIVTASLNNVSSLNSMGDNNLLWSDLLGEDNND